MTISFPDPAGFVGSTFGLVTNTQTFQSPFTRNTQRLILGLGLWSASYTLRRMRRSEQLAADWMAFFLQCQGQANAFDAYDPDRKSPRGALGGTPLVNGAGQTGNTLAIDGCTPGVVNWARAGDYFSCNGELKQLTAPVTTNGSGQATLTFQPAMRSSPPDNTPLNFDRPTCTMILVDDKQGIWDCDAAGTYEQKTFSATEVF